MDGGIAAGGGIARAGDDARRVGRGERIERIEDARCLADLERLFGVAREPDPEPERRPVQFYAVGSNDLEREYTDDGEFVDERQLTELGSVDWT